jgi:hypothetical protein
LFIDQITEYISLRSAFEKLQRIAGRAKPLNALFLVAHVQFEWVQVGAYNRKSPIGIGLGHEGLFASNVSLWKAIQGRTKNIIVYSCLAARTQPDMVGTFGDMKYLMGALAIHTGAYVYAADQQQCADVQPKDVDFGPWEGALFEFPPSGAPPRQVAQAPYNLSEV